MLHLNPHAQSQIIGRNKGLKKPIVNPKGIKHYCIPLKWHLFDVKKCERWSRKRRTSRWDKNLKNLIFLHFDGSISSSTLKISKFVGCSRNPMKRLSRNERATSIWNFANSRRFKNSLSQDSFKGKEAQNCSIA